MTAWAGGPGGIVAVAKQVSLTATERRLPVFVD